MNNVLLIYIDSGIYHISNVFVNGNFGYENTTAKQASGSETVKLAPSSLFNLIVVVIPLTFHEFLCSHCLSGYLYSL